MTELNEGTRAAPSAAQQTGDTDRVRRVVVAGLLVPAAMVVALWLVVGPHDAYDRVMFPAALLGHAVLLLGLLTRRLSHRAAGSGLLLVMLVVLGGRAVTLALPSGTISTYGVVLAALLPWGGVSFALAFVVLGTKAGLRFSGLLYVALLVAGAVAIVHDRPDAGSLDALPFVAASAAAAQGLLVCLLWLLASRLEQLAAADRRVDRLAAEAGTDPLTGAANRRRLDDELGRTLAQARRHDEPMSVVLVDLDHFKQVNDRFGHEVGDGVLVAVVGALARTLRAGDLLGRWGGEELLLLAPHTGHAAACELAERCRRAVERTPTAAGGVTASFGVATRGATDDARTLIRRADHALYAAKRQGRNRVCGIECDPERPEGCGIGPPDARAAAPHSTGASSSSRPTAEASSAGRATESTAWW